MLCSLAQLRAMQGEFERARELVRAARTVLDDLGVIVLAAATAIDSARVELLAGDLVTAERELRQAEETLTALGEKYLLPPLAAVLAQVVYAQGRADEAEQITRRAQELSDPEDVEPQALWRSVRAKVLAGRDLADEAEQLAREAVRLMRTTDPRDAGRRPARPGRGAESLGQPGRGPRGSRRGEGPLREQGKHSRRRPGDGVARRARAVAIPARWGRRRPARARRVARSSSSASTSR